MMPNKYLYTKPTAAEVVAKMRAANLSVSDMVKLTGRHFFDIKRMMGEGEAMKPNMAETILLDYLEEHPDAAEIMLDMAEVRIVGQAHKP
jgi:hypothetical protein